MYAVVEGDSYHLNHPPTPPLPQLPSHQLLIISLSPLPHAQPAEELITNMQPQFYDIGRLLPSLYYSI